MIRLDRPALRELNPIAALAAEFRAAIECCPRERLPIGLSDFPKGACGDATLLLAEYLERNGQASIMYSAIGTDVRMPGCAAEPCRRHHRWSIRRWESARHSRGTVQMAHNLWTEFRRWAPRRLPEIRRINGREPRGGLSPDNRTSR